jgi:hypothetical protein
VREKSELVCVDWNKTEGHLLLYGSQSGFYVLKDLRKLKDDLLREQLSHVPVRKVAFHPTDPAVYGVGSDMIYFYHVRPPY